MKHKSLSLNLLMELWWSFMSAVCMSAWRVCTTAAKCQSLLIMSTSPFCSWCLISWIINLSLFVHVYSNESTQLVNNRIFYLCYLKDENNEERLTFSSHSLRVLKVLYQFLTTQYSFVKSFDCSVAINPLKWILYLQPQFEKSCDVLLNAIQLVLSND